MKNLSKSAFITVLALVCYTGFATAQTVSFDKAGDISNLVNDLKFGGPGGPGGHGGPGGPGGHGGGFVPTPPPPSFDHGGDHGGGFDHGGDHGGPGHHDGPGPQPGPWHPQPGPQPDPWHPQPGPQPGPWHPQPGPQPGPWHPHNDGHPDWDHNDWNNNQWNHHDAFHNDWWNNYDIWWNSNSHPYSMYRTACTVIPGVSAKGYIIEQTMPFNGIATFYFYDAFDTIVGASSPTNGIYRGGDGTPVFDFYQVPQADHCFMAITQ